MSEFINQIDNEFYNYLSSGKHTLTKIKEYISNGANINAIDEYSESLLSKIILEKSNTKYGIKLIKWIIDLGANLDNQDRDGTTALFSATIVHSFEIVSYLLKKGANPNLIVEDTNDTVLNLADFDYFYHSTEAKRKYNREHNRESANQAKKIVQVLKKYGAKYSSEVFANKIEKYINVFATEVTGLVTKNGMLKPENLPNVSNEFVENFNKWKSENPDCWNDYVYDKKTARIINLPDKELFVKHNKVGLNIAKQIKKMGGNDIEVCFQFVKTDKNFEVRNVGNKIIE